MKSIILLLGLFLSTSSYGQCEISNLNQEERILLETFWQEFRLSINRKDTLGLMNLCNYPISCSYCKKTKDTPSPTISIILLFLSPKFIEEINKHNLIENYFVVNENFNEKTKGCSYAFPFKKQNGQILYFKITQINGVYKINSTSTKR